MLMVSDSAREKILVLLKAEGKDPAEYGLRVGVKGGGCSGLTYFMAFDKPKPGDQTFTNGDAKVLVDPKSHLFVNGSELNYLEGLQGAGFAVQNPNVKGSCGCGTSFSV
jgi:iron-sulfur cluster assembly protein